MTCSPRPLVALLIPLLAVLAGCGSGGPGASVPEVPVCSGGARLVNNQCLCALGTSWIDGTCQGQAQAGTCAGGGAQFGNVCFCLDGAFWNEPTQRCEPLQCTGGSVVSMNSCVCPAGRVWENQACQVTCIPGAVRTDPDTCVCPPGTENKGEVFGCQAIDCQLGTYWNGVACVDNRQAPTPAPSPVTPNQSFSCCINGAAYDCPDSPSFDRCMTLDPSGCQRVNRSCN